MATETTRMRFPWALTLFVALAMALLVWLGVWQMQRLQWKEGLIAEAEAAADMPPATLTALTREGMPEFRKVRLTCFGLDVSPYVELQTIQEGQPGARLISPCQTPAFRAGETLPAIFLVDRGFLDETISARPPESLSGRAVEIVAEIRRLPPPNPMAPRPEGRRFYGRDFEAMAEALPISGPVEPQMLFALTSSNPDWAALRPSAPPAAFSNNHLGYAITWFGLALALLGFYVAMLRRALKTSQVSI